MADAEQFSSAQELAELAANWPSLRLVAIFNSLPGQIPVKKFMDRKKAVSRIWAAIEKLSPGEQADHDGNTETPEDPANTEPVQDPPTDVVADVDAHRQPVAPETPPAGEQTTAPEKPRVARDGSKTAQILDMLKRPGGATLNEIMAAANWQKHSVRGFIAGSVGKKMRIAVTSSKREDGQRVYSIT